MVIVRTVMPWIAPVVTVRLQSWTDRSQKTLASNAVSPARHPFESRRIAATTRRKSERCSISEEITAIAALTD